MPDARTRSAILELATYLTQPIPKIGVMLAGECGNGKTTLMYAFRRVLNYLKALNSFSYMDPRFHIGMEIVKSNDIADSKITSPSRFDKLKRASMLGIDELGEEPAMIVEYGTYKFPLTRLLEERYDRQLFTFVTTNLDGDMLLKTYKERIYDRILEMFHIIAFDPGSYR